MINILYNLSSKFFLTSGIMSKIEGRISILYPMDGQSVKKKAVLQLIRIYTMVLAMIIGIMYFADMELYMVVIVGATVYFVANNRAYKQLDRLEVELLEYMLKFIETVKFKFQFDGMLQEAILDATTECNDIMGLHGQLIYEYLQRSYIKEDCEYQEVSPNQFFLTFYSLCESVMKYGDKKTEKGSLFVKNLGYLKEDIHLELLKKKSVENTFMGLTGICIVPIFCIKPIEIWGISNMPELAENYSSKIGIFITILLTVVSLVTYQIIIHLKYPVSSYGQKKEWILRLMKNNFVKKFNTSYMNRRIRSMQKIDGLLKTVGYPHNVAEFCVGRFIKALVAAGFSILLSLTIGFGIVSIFFGIVGYICMYYGPECMIKLKRQLMIMERESEIIRFQGIILMLMYADRITIDQILSQLERFAISFKQQIEEISDKLSYKGMSVFKEYRDKSDFMPFNRIIDGFIACDDMYIHRAFEDVETDRQYYIAKHKQDNKFYIEQRGAVGKFLSFIPICLVVIVKLIVPFVIEGMNQMSISGMGL